MANGFQVTKEDWEHMTPELRAWMTFNAVQNIDRRLTKLESRKWVDKTCSFAGGIIGGICAYFGGKAI
jgi:hypothetical protein